MRLSVLFAGLVVIGGLLGCQSSTPSPSLTGLTFATITPLSSKVAQLPSPTVTPATPLSFPTERATLTPADRATPPVVTATPWPNPRVIAASPNGFLNVRSGPGAAYHPPLGTYNNGAVAEVIGKQKDAAGELWWLIRFNAGVNNQGWVYAGFTEAENVADVPWVTAPPLPTALIVTPSPTPTAHAIIDSPDGFLSIRSGPGRVYEPPLGAYNNGATVPIIGKQFDVEERGLWWLIPFSASPTGQGWIVANFTLAHSTDNVPWVNPPPTPMPSATRLPTPTNTPISPPLTNWSISGRVLDAVTAQPVGGAAVEATLGNDGTALLTVTDSQGNFSLVAKALDAGDLVLTITAEGYVARTVAAGPLTPRQYNFTGLELTPQQAPTLTWAISGWVSETESDVPVSEAVVEAILGDDGLRLETITAANGHFSMSGEANDSGRLTLNISAPGYQPNSFISEQVDSRIYSLPDLKLTPLTNN